MGFIHDFRIRPSQRVVFGLFAAATVLGLSACIPQQEATQRRLIPDWNDLPDRGRFFKADTTLSDSVPQPALPVRADSLIPFPPDSVAIVPDSIRTRPDSALVTRKKTWEEKLADSLQFTNDSTARLEQMTFRRPQSFVPDPAMDIRYNLFLSQPNSIQKKVDIDSSLSTVVIRETIGDLTLRGPIALPYETYVNERFQSNIQSTWRSLTGTRVTTKKADAIEELFSKITNVDIYVPTGGSALFRTIFGPPRINIRVNGSIDVKAGWATRFNSINESTTGTGTTNDPVFDQQFQMNVQGTVGDKLQISADWSTQRTFEYENSLRVVYTGYEDEIIKKIEAGNVSLTTPSSYVSGSSALFGIKSTMQMGPLTWTFLVSQQKGKTEKRSITGGQQKKEINIPAWQYDYDRHFFFSRYYREFYEKAFVPTLPALLQSEAPVIQYEVWKQKTTQGTPKEELEAVALLKLGENPGTKPGETVGLPGGDGPFTTDQLARLRNRTATPIDLGISNKEYAIGTFIKLQEGTDYEIDKETGILHIYTQIEQTAAIAIAYEVQLAGSNQTARIGDFAISAGQAGEQRNRLVLKLVRPQSLNNSNKEAWDLMLKNIYSLGSADFIEADLELDLTVLENNQAQRSLPGSNNNLLDILGLNVQGPNASPEKDDKFDFRPGITVRPRRGEIVFPFLKPFNSTALINEVNASSIPDNKKEDYLFAELYDTTQQAARISDDKYYIKGSVKGSISDRYTLGAFNLVEGSVKVLSNGIPLIANVDYEVDYQLGSLQIKNRAYLTPGSNISVEFESNDLFTLASKNFIGSRFDLDLTEELKLGFSWLRYSEKPLTDKVRVGEEPKLNNIIGVDGRWSTEARWLTRALNVLPGVKTSQVSEFSVSGEVAQIIPGHPDELNTTLDPDGVAYIDDFEGSKKAITAGLNYTSWSLSSVPDTSLTGWKNLPVPDFRKVDSTLTNYRAWLKYYNDYARRIPIQDIWPDRSVSSRDNSITPFVFDYQPKKRGPFNYSTRLDQTIYNTSGETWAGIQKAMPSYMTNLAAENIEFLEFWFQVTDNETSALYTDRKGGFLNIDLGYISEDILPDGQLNTELGISQQRNSTASTWGRRPISTSASQFSENDDVGLDGLNNPDEAEFYSAFRASLDAIGIDQEEKERILSDISGDNYSFNQGSYDFTRINGSENNTRVSGSQDRIYPDSEDMNASTFLDQANDYYNFRVAIHPDSLKAGVGYIVSGNESSKWYQVRIPLTEFRKKVGTIENLGDIRYMRIWLAGFENPVYMQFATIDFVGNQWLITKNEKNQRDSVLSVAVINIEENPDKYNSPPGIQREKDRTRPDENIQLNEQSLEISAFRLEDGMERSIQRNIGGNTGMNITNYKRLKMFVHGPDESPTGTDTPVLFVDTTNYDAEVFIRFGPDSKSYYEISLPLHPDRRKGSAGPATWSPENTFDIDLASLTAYKTKKIAGRDSLVIKNPPGYPDGTRILLRGTPTLTQIKQINIGLRNPAGKGSALPLNFSIWVNELRVSGYREETGWAAKTALGVKLADIGTVNFSIERTDAEFRRVTESISNNKETRTSWSVGGQFGLEKFLNNTQEVAIPLSIRHSESVSEPKFLAGSDIQLSEAAKLDSNGAKLIDRNRTISVSNEISLNGIKKVKPSENPFLQATIDRITLDFSYSNDYARSPQEDWRRSWDWRSRLDYSYRFAQDLYWEPFAPLEDLTGKDYFLLDDETIKNWAGTRIFLKPQSIGFGMSITRSRSQSKSRVKEKPDEPSMQFNANHSFNIAFPFTQDLTFTMSGATASTLQDLLRDSEKNERPEGEIFSDLFSRLARLDLGTDLSYTQSMAFGYKIPILRWANLTTSYSSQYSWRNPNAGAGAKSINIGNAAGWATSFSVRSNMDLRSIFSDSDTKLQSAEKVKRDSLAAHEKLWSDVKSIGKAFLSLDAIGINFSQQNSFSTNGLAGQSGFLNFYPFNAEWWPDGFGFYKPNVIRGPGLAFQLGLSKDAGPRYFSGDSTIKVNPTENFSQSNSLDWRTGFQPFENVKTELSWKVTWNYSQETRLNPITFKTEQLTKKGGFTRSFISIFGDFKSIQKNIPTNKETGNYITGNNEMVAAFRDGLELFGLSEKITNVMGLGIFTVPGEWQDLVPLPNWTITVTGLEKFPLWSSFFRTVTMNHSYTGDYQTSYGIRQDAGKPYLNPNTNDTLFVPRKEFQSPRVSERFAPLVGFTFAFNKPLTARLNFNMGRSITLSTVNFQLSTQNTQELSGSLSYSQSGSTLLNFWPFNGNTLKNDIDLSMTGSYAVDETVIEPLTADQASAAPPSGTTRITIEPRIGYAISSRVNASAFWRYTNSKPISGSLSAAEISASEIGVNIHISIQ